MGPMMTKKEKGTESTSLCASTRIKVSYEQDWRGNEPKKPPDMKFVISPVVNRCLALLLSLNDFL